MGRLEDAVHLTDPDRRLSDLIQDAVRADMQGTVCGAAFAASRLGMRQVH